MILMLYLNDTHGVCSVSHSQTMPVISAVTSPRQDTRLRRSERECHPSAVPNGGLRLWIPYSHPKDSVIIDYEHSCATCIYDLYNVMYVLVYIYIYMFYDT